MYKFNEDQFIENEDYLLRLFSKDDLEDLLKVYGDKDVLPYINSDNCDGDNFYYSTKEKMNSVLDFWEYSYENNWFLRLSILEKRSNSVIGSIELCLRVSDDEFNDMAILRIDVSKVNENEKTLYSLFSLITPYINEIVGGKAIITKAPIYEIERIEAIKRVGYKKTNNSLVGKDQTLYYDYWVY